MLENVSVVFAEKDMYLKKMRRVTYENNMENFEKNYAEFFEEVFAKVASATDKQAVAEEIGESFASQMRSAFVTKKRIPTQLAMDLNLMMIYYVFPSFLRTNNPDATVVADAFKKKWNEVFECSIDYADYATIREGFSNKLFGLF